MKQDKPLLSAGVQHQPDSRGIPKYGWNLSRSPLKQRFDDLYNCNLVIKRQVFELGGGVVVVNLLAE